MSRTDFSTSTPPCSHPAEAFALDRLMSPPGRFADPFEILRDDALAQDEKRAILSSWASDACAVDSAPALRQPPGARRPIPIDAIMDAATAGP